MIPESSTYPQSQVTTPAGNGLAVVPSDSVDLPEFNREIYVGTEGDITVIMAANGEQITYKNIPSGTRLPYVVSRILATGTDATDIVIVW